MEITITKFKNHGNHVSGVLGLNFLGQTRKHLLEWCENIKV